MIEQIVISYLNRNMDIEAYAEVPEKPPAKFIVIEKTGSSLVNRIKYATIAVQSWAKRMEDAMLLNEAVKDAMLDGLVTLDEIGSITLNSDYNFTDTSTRTYRYQAVFDIVHY